MIFELQGKTIKHAVSRTENGAVTLELKFTDGTDFEYQVRPFPKANGRLFDCDGEVTGRSE